MPKGKSGIKRAGGGSKSKQSAPVDMVRGVLQSEIDKLRGERDHMLPKSITWMTIQDDYKRVGIPITDKEAQDIAQAIKDFSFGHDTDMRKAKSKQQKGEVLREIEKKYLAQYDAIAEYCRVAPILPQKKYHTVHRGIKLSTITPEYAQGILSMKVGDTWNVDNMPTSFSTSLKTAQNFSMHAGKKGIIIHMSTAGMKNSPSIRGISLCPGENEVMVTDYNWKITHITDNLNNGGYYEMYVEHS